MNVFLGSQSIASARATIAEIDEFARPCPASCDDGTGRAPQ
jgi:hypothetical protein